MISREMKKLAMDKALDFVADQGKDVDDSYIIGVYQAILEQMVSELKMK